ncbi:hypothetical protein Tco_0601004 [Tanacetum coccineum]
MPLGEHAAHWANYLGELVRELPLHYPSWRQVPAEQKARVMARLGKPSLTCVPTWNTIAGYLSSASCSIYKRSTIGSRMLLWKVHWIPDSAGTYDMERISLSCLRPFRGQLGMRRLRSGMDPRNHGETQLLESNVADPLHLFLTHSVTDGLGSNTETGVPYTEDEILGNHFAVGKAAGAHSRFDDMLKWVGLIILRLEEAFLNTELPKGGHGVVARTLDGGFCVVLVFGLGWNCIPLVWLEFGLWVMIGDGGLGVWIGVEIGDGWWVRWSVGVLMWGGDGMMETTTVWECVAEYFV